MTINAEAPLLKTESGELSNTIATQTMDTLPLLTIGTNSSGIRNPFNLVALLPGAYYQPSPCSPDQWCISTAPRAARKPF